MISFTIDLKVNGSLGLNRLYSGVHWAVRKQQADYIHALVVNELKRQGIKRAPSSKPVKLTFYFNSRLDLSNHGYLVKLIEDALKGYLISDDSRKIVKSITMKWHNGEGVRVEVDTAKA